MVCASDVQEGRRYARLGGCSTMHFLRRYDRHARLYVLLSQTIADGAVYMSARLFTSHPRFHLPCFE